MAHINEKEIARQLEEMLDTKAWALLSGWLTGKAEQAKKDLVAQKFTNLAEVQSLQARVQLIDEFFAEIKNRIGKGRTTSYIYPIKE
ncbi:MAG: hypothetical protein DDT19_02938 [Syntrophomonadaceae bacterium]|nr:hypothetical protein [Bacillota bacterium]MBT9169576.1 hypothetical protein [Bacillota bacterium]